MQDHELLEMAAKARELREGVDLNWWNPLRDEGSAMRLACYLRISLEWDEDLGIVMASQYKTKGFPVIRENFTGRVNEATCRAIVRAAAEIGKLTP